MCVHLRRCVVRRRDAGVEQRTGQTRRRVGIEARRILLLPLHGWFSGSEIEWTGGRVHEEHVRRLQRGSEEAADCRRARGTQSGRQWRRWRVQRRGVALHAEREGEAGGSDRRLAWRGGGDTRAHTGGQLSEGGAQKRGARHRTKQKRLGHAHSRNRGKSLRYTFADIYEVTVTLHRTKRAGRGERNLQKSLLLDFRGVK